MIEAHLADGTRLQFPDGTDPDVVQRTVKGLIAQGIGKPAETDVAGEVGAVGSGAVRGVANLAGLPVDAVNAGLNLLGIGTAKPVGGSEWWKDRAGDVVDVGNRVAGVEGPGGRAVIDAQAQTTLGRLGSRAAEEVGASLLPMAGAYRLGAGAVRAVPSVRGGVVDALGGTSTGDRAAQLVASAGAGLGAGVAQEAMPGSQVAEFAGGLLGGTATLGGIGVAGQARNFVAPLMSPGARQEAAGHTLRQFATSPDALVGAPSEIVPGSPLTTAQSAADPGLASLERTLRSQQGPGPLFAVRDAERAAAQRGAMQGLAPEGGGAEDVAAMVRGRLGQFEQRTGQRAGAAQERVDQRVGALGPGLDPVAAGRAVREELGGARDTAKRAESNLWQRLQDNEDLALEVGAGPANARKMLGEISPSAKPPSGDAAGVLEAAANLGGVVRWRELQDLRSWAAQTSSDLARAGDAVNKRRVDAVLRGIDDDIARTVGDDPVPGPGARPNGGGDTSPPPGPSEAWPKVGDDAATAEAPPGGGGAGVPPGGAGNGPAAGGAGGGGGSSVVGDGLTPNFGPEDAAAYRAARAATAERKQTFDRGAPGQVLQQGGYNARGEAGYAMPAEQVAGRFFNAGKASATDMAEFLRAAESRPAAVEALRDYAIGDLRRAAVDEAGRVDPKKWAGWIAKHDAPLRSFPEVRREFSNVAAAQRSVDRLQARRDQAVKGFEKSDAGKFLDRDADAAFAAVISSGNRTEGLRQLVRMAKGDADKLGQLRRAAVDNLVRTIENAGSVDALQNQSLSPAKTVRFMANNGKALQKSGLLTPGQIAVLRKVEEDMNRAVYAQTVGKAVGSNTFQNFAAGAVLGQLSMGYAKPNGLLANTIGRAGNLIFKIADREVQKLVADAMLDPSLARELMAKATPDRMLWLNQMLKRRAIATGLIAGATADGEQ